MIRLLIASNVCIFRESLGYLFTSHDGFNVIGGASELREVVTETLALAPEILILDFAMVEFYATARETQKIAPNVRIVAVAVPEIESVILECAGVGVVGYVSCHASVDYLIGVLHNVMQNDLHCSPKLAWILMRRVATLSSQRGDSTPEAARFTVREREIIGLLQQDLSNKDIASRLGVEVATVKNHVHNILDKLHVHRRTEAARIATFPSAGVQRKMTG